MEMEDILNLPSGEELAAGLTDHDDLGGMLSAVEAHIESAAAQAEEFEAGIEGVESVDADVFTKLTDVHEAIVSEQEARLSAALEKEQAEVEAKAKRQAALDLLKSTSVELAVEEDSVDEPVVDEAPEDDAVVSDEDIADLGDGSKSFADVNLQAGAAKTPTASGMFNANSGIAGSNMNRGADMQFDVVDPLGRDQYNIGEVQLTRGAEVLASGAKLNGERINAGDSIKSSKDMTKVFAAAMNSTMAKGKFSGSQQIPLVASSWNHGKYAITDGMTDQEQADIVNEVVAAHSKQSGSKSALVASCAEYDSCCPIPPLETMREIIRCTGVSGTPWRDSLPTINVQNSGGLRWMVEPDPYLARAAIGSVTAAENCAGYGSTADETIPEGGAPFKTESCVRVPCPTINDICVDELFACVIIDNLQFRVWPQLVELFLERIDQAFDERIEAKIASAIDAASTPVLAKNRDLDTWRNFHEALRKARAGFAGKYNCGPNERLEIHMPSYMVDKIAVGLVNDHSNGYGERLFNNSNEAVVNAIRAVGYEPFIFDDDIMGPTGPRGQVVGTDGVPGVIVEDGTYCLQDFPETEISYIYKEGTFAYLDGGDMETGLYRDHSLNGTNDAAIFRTHHCEIAQLGCESLMLVTNSDPCGKGAPLGSCELTPLAPEDVPGGIAVKEEAVKIDAANPEG